MKILKQFKLICVHLVQLRQGSVEPSDRCKWQKANCPVWADLSLNNNGVVLLGNSEHCLFMRISRNIRSCIK